MRDGVCDGCVSVPESLLKESLLILKKNRQVRLAITRYYHYHYEY